LRDIVPSYAEKKKRIQQLIEADAFEDIIEEKKVSSPKGRIYVPSKFINHRAIIIIEPLLEEEGRGLDS
jgi:hypothetical protein